MGAFSGSREPNQQAVSALPGFDPERWVMTKGTIPDLPADKIIYAMGRYGDVFGPLPFKTWLDSAWLGECFYASHDLIGYQVAQ